MWVFDGEYWTDEASECGKEAPGMIAYLHHQELRLELRIQEMEPPPGLGEDVDASPPVDSLYCPYAAPA